MSGRCLDGVPGCLRMSGSYLGVSGICLGEYRCHINHKQLNRSRHIAFSPSDLPRQKVLHFGVSVGCLEGVCKVSGGCLGDSEYCLGGYNAKSIDKSSLGIILISWFLFSQWLPISDVCRVSVGCLEGVWNVSGGCLGDYGYFLGGYNAKAIDKFPMGIILIS